MNAEKFLEASRIATEQQIIPKLFTPAQLAEMQQPFHQTWDYYGFVPLMTAEKAFAAYDGAKPQLSINDPRITDAQIKALPPTITVDYEGSQYTVPLRVYSGARESVADWQEKLAFQRRSREAIASIETGLSSKFNLTSGYDYSIGYGIGLVDNEKAASFIVQLYNDKARKVSRDVGKYMEEELKTLTPERKSQVLLSGPVRFL